MKKVYISRNYRGPYTAQSKAKLDAEAIIRKNGFKNIGLPSRSYENHTIGRIWSVISTLIGKLRLPNNGIVFLQFPATWQMTEIIKKAKAKGNKIIVLVHDIENLRYGKYGSLDFIKDIDCLIVHTENMARYILELYPSANVVILGIFDYLSNARTSYVHSQCNYSVAFAGNIGKSEFIKKLASLPVKFKLFGIGGESIAKSSNLAYRGCYHPTELGIHLDADFGLVWDGTDVNECTGSLGHYLKFIAPHKLSMYLSAGLPVIVWKDSAVASFVKNNGIGLVVKSLLELPEIFVNLTNDEYLRMKKNACEMAEKVCEGSFLTKALKTALN